MSESAFAVCVVGLYGAYAYWMWRRLAPATAPLTVALRRMFVVGSIVACTWMLGAAAFMALAPIR